MKNPVYIETRGEHWILSNKAHKLAGDQLLALTGYRGNCLKAHWLCPDGKVSEENLHWEGNHFPSLSPHLPEVAWDEREIQDLFGYVPEGHPDARPLVRTPRWPTEFFPLADTIDLKLNWLETEPDNPALTAEGEGITVMKVGPTHAGIIESGHFVFSLMGENVLYLDAHLFQNHRGLEKALENLDPYHALPLVSRICGADTVSHQYNLVSAVERLAGREVPESLKWQRILVLEAERILSHLNDLAQIPAGTGFQVANQRGLAMKERWQRGLAQAFGHRYMFDTLSFGSVHIRDLDSLGTLINAFEKEWSRWRRLVDNHQGFHDRMRGPGVIRRDDAERLGAVGVALRATGIASDVRTMMPLYQEIGFNPAKADGGDVEARFQIRLQEIESSTRIIKTALEQVNSRFEYDWKPPLDLSGDVVGYSESPHGLNAHVIQLAHGRIRRYHIRSGAFRNWPILAVAVAGNAMVDFPLINKSFELCYSCTDR